jgi:hypothetical protein
MNNYICDLDINCGDRDGPGQWRYCYSCLMASPIGVYCRQCCRSLCEFCRKVGVGSCWECAGSDRTD